ncbi:MAG: histone deacetylase family protein, partial [Granulosicoccaceae bacterium]
CEQHEMGSGHPECPERLVAISDALELAGLSAQLDQRLAPMADHETIALAHPASYVRQIFDASPSDGRSRLDGDTSMNPFTLEAAQRAAGAAVAAVDAVMAGEVKNAFCQTRPPGHHAEQSQAMGFCLFGNVAIAAKHALEHHGLERVAIVDFDVHHGNGTEDLVKGDQRILFCSSFMHPHYPGYFGKNVPGMRINSPLEGGADSVTFRAVIEEHWLPALREQQPQMVFISAGFDAHRDDPLGGLALLEDDFHWATKQFMQVADEFAEGRVVSCLEGGYNLQALGRSAVAHVQALLGQ